MVSIIVRVTIARTHYGCIKPGVSSAAMRSKACKAHRAGAK